VLPAVASRKVLRLFARKSEAVKPTIGFGDPLFDNHDGGSSAMSKAKATTPHRQRGYAA
jgi:hypothetical protein